MKRIIFSFILILLAIGFYQLTQRTETPQPPSKPTTHTFHEKYYQTQFCTSIHGEMEVILEDRTRVDCLTDEYAVEVDFAKKWAESIGQSLFYADVTNRKPAIALIVGTKDQRYVTRLKRITDKLNITVFILTKVE